MPERFTACIRGENLWLPIIPSRCAGTDYMEISLAFLVMNVEMAEC